MQNHTIFSLIVISIVILGTDCSLPQAGNSPGTGGSGNNQSGGNYSKFNAWDGVSQVSLYTGEASGGGIGPAIHDAILAHTTAVITIPSLDANHDYTYTLGDKSGTIRADAEGKLVITQENLSGSNATDGAKLVINKLEGTASTEKVLAVYHPKQIFTWQDLQAMRLDLSGNYILMKDIVFPDLNLPGLPAAGFEPIGDGNLGKHFTGSLDGNGKTITGFYIHRPSSSYAGLFSSIKAEPDAEAVKNLTFHNASVTANQNVGVLAGELSRGLVSNISVTVDAAERKNKTLTGTSSVGGLVGYVSYGSVIGKSDIHVRGSNANVGGLVGENKGGRVTGYATGNVSGIGGVGGLVGNNSGTIIGYATGNVSGGNSVGGLVGLNDDVGTIIGYATGTLLGSATSEGHPTRIGGLVGQNSGKLTGYTRSVITLANKGTDNGPVLGSGNLGSGSAAYYSGRRGKYAFVNLNGIALLANTIGTKVIVGTNPDRTAFGNFTFGTTVGQWVWGDGKWPAINLGSTESVAKIAEQPTTPYTEATVIKAPTNFVFHNSGATDSIHLRWVSLIHSNSGAGKTAEGDTINYLYDVAIELYYLQSDKDDEPVDAILAANNKYGNYLNGTATEATLAGLASGKRYHVLLRVVNKTDVSKTDDLKAVFTTK